MGDEDPVQDVREALRKYREAQIYITFAELDIAPALANRSLPVAELASRTGSDPNALRRFVNAALALGLLQLNGDLVRLTDFGNRIYSASSGTSIANTLKLEGAFYDRWGRLAEAVRSGSRPEENRAQEDDPDWVRKFTTALYESSRASADVIASTLDDIFPSTSVTPIRVLDLGGGHGGYAIALAHRRPDIQATVFDLPPVIAVTREIIASNQAGHRVACVAGDFHQDSTGSGFDAVLLFGVLHGETPEGARKLLTTVREALSPDGLLVIRSKGCEQGETAPGERELFDLHMLLSTSGGQVQRAADTQSLVEQNGFRLDSVRDIHAPGSGQLLLFRHQATGPD